MGIKDFFIRKMVESKMGSLPKEQQEMIVGAIQKNPDFFANLAKEIEEESKNGKDQIQAAMEVIKRHQNELQKILKN